MMNTMPKPLGVAGIAVMIVAMLLVAPALTLAQTQEPFAGPPGTATCVTSTDSPTPGTVFKLAIPDASSYAGIDYTCPGCTAAAGAAPLTPPSFYFKRMSRAHHPAALRGL
jgi:hypothetical protein